MANKYEPKLCEDLIKARRASCGLTKELEVVKAAAVALPSDLSNGLANPTLPPGFARVSDFKAHCDGNDSEILKKIVDAGILTCAALINAR